MKRNRTNRYAKSVRLFAVLFLVVVNVCFLSATDETHIHSLKNVTVQLSTEFAKIGVDELGVSFINDLYSKLKCTLVLQNVDKLLDKMSENLASKLNETLELLNRTHEEIERVFDVSEESFNTVGSVVSHCEGGIGSNESVYENGSSSSIYKVLNKEINKVKKLKSAVKQFYFLSTHDVSDTCNIPFSACKGHDHSLIWKQFMKRSEKSVPKNIVLLLDNGGSLSKQQFLIVKTVAKQIISALNPEDKIGLLAISDEWSSPFLTAQCLMLSQMHLQNSSHYISTATSHNKYIFNKFINSLSKGNGITNHTLGFRQAFNIIRSSNLDPNETIMLFYISRGLLSSLTEAKAVLQTLATMTSQTKNPVVINSCAVIDDSKPVIYEMHFLRDIAEQNYSKYNIKTAGEALRGITISVNSIQGVGLAVARLYNSLGNLVSFGSGSEISLPLWDDIAKDITVSVTLPYQSNGKVGLLGVDLFYAYIVEDVAYYSSYLDYTYAFIVNLQGIVITHPVYPKPTSIKQLPKFVDIVHLEKYEHFQHVRKLILTEKEGSHTLLSNNDTVKFDWRRVHDYFVVCIVTLTNGTPPVRPPKVALFSKFSDTKLVHHRLDILPNDNMCRHMNQIATLDAGSLYLGASCFQSPFSHINSFSSEATLPLSIQNYMAYLKDNTRLLANPGLREDVRDDVVILAHILEFLRMQHLTGLRTNYIVRRYVVSPSGVLQLFPGSYVSPEIEPTKRMWYLRAVEHKKRVILTPPYLDAGGAGYIVTVAYASEHVVTAIDVTFGYVYKLMLEKMPFCHMNKNTKCFIMDDRGYLVYHPNLIDPSGHGPIEQQHIIHKESLVANDLLNRYKLVKKMVCNNYADGTIQRFYKLNTSFTDILASGVQSEQCVKYQVGLIEGTNIFVGVVEANCAMVATFCPCSMVDRLCLNCNRMESRECECPCECPLNFDGCVRLNRSYSYENPLCHDLPEQTVSLAPETADEQLKSCIPISCESRNSYESCLGVVGCEWCQYDVDAETPLSNSFCASFATCFNGILGSVTPYGDAVVGPSSSEDLLSPRYSTLGPIVGSIVAAFLVSGLLFICYRSYSSSSGERFYLAAIQENRVRMSEFNISDDFHDGDNHQDRLLQDKKLEPISPYCVSTGYRRPLTAAESDHGYSTMTPHEESEHLSFAPVEFDSLDDCTSDAASINTSVSSKPSKSTMSDIRNKSKLLTPSLRMDLQMTSIPNRIIAPVTVHRNNEIPIQ